MTLSIRTYSLHTSLIPIVTDTWVPQIDEWQLVLVTSLHDTKGLTNILAHNYRISDAGIYQSVPVRRLFVKSPEDPIAKTLVQEIKTASEGSVHIIRDARKNNGHTQYAAVFAPYSGVADPYLRCG